MIEDTTYEIPFPLDKYYGYVIIGTGGVGGHIAIQLASLLNHYKTYIGFPVEPFIVLIDYDIVDNRFLNRIPELYMYEYAYGEKKVEVLKDYIQTAVKWRFVKVFAEKFNDKLADSLCKYFIQNYFSIIAVDSIPARKEVESILKDYKKPFIHIGFDNHRLTIFKSVQDGVIIDMDTTQNQRQSSYMTPPTPFELRYASIKALESIIDIPIGVYNELEDTIISR